jgi:hypothetical protein
VHHRVGYQLSLAAMSTPAITRRTALGVQHRQLARRAPEAEALVVHVARLIERR